MKATPSLLPPNATPLERALEMLAAVRLGTVDTPFRELWNAQTCPEELLPYLAWGLSVDQWSADWPLYIRRARVASAIAIQRRKGTPKSVVDVINSFGGSVKLREWFEMTPPGVSHTFSLSVSLGGQSDDAPSADFINAVIAEVNCTKPVRSQYDFSVALPASRALGHPRVAARAGRRRIWPRCRLARRARWQLLRQHSGSPRLYAVQ